MTNRFKGIIMLFICNFIFFKSQAQNGSLNPTLEKVIPPSPNASALNKFGNVPVGPSTGIPQINVPVYAYENKATGLKLSVSLDYHAGGIRVDEMSSNVGIGWALNAGGVISRTVRGIYDEMSGIGFIKSPALPASEVEGNIGGSVSTRPFIYFYSLEKDEQNDMFSFNFNGRSGKFLFGKNDSLLMINQQKLKIDKEISQIDGQLQGYPMISKFTITDENGYKYIFDDEEITHNRSFGTAAAVYTSSWYLSKIIAPAEKDEIDFEYENTTVIYNAAKSASETFNYPGVYSGLPSRPYTASVSPLTVKGKRLSKIIFPNGVNIEFKYSLTEQTESSSGDFLLKKIVIKNKDQQNGFALEHDLSLNRPTLKKVVPFSGTSEIQDIPYEFTYDIALPARLSNEQDHWGFYNYNSGSLIPSEIINVGLGGNYGQYHELAGGNRDTDPLRCKAGSLKRIKYPTGGYTDFDMESNTAVDPRLNQKVNFVRKIYSYEDNKTFECHSNNAQGTITNFTFNGDPNSATNITVTIPSHNNCSGTGICKIIMEIRNSSNFLLDIYEFNSPSSSSPAVFSFTKNYFVPGVYTITAYSQGLTNYSGYLNFKWVEVRNQNPIEVRTTIGHNQLYVGGLRVKRISDYTGNSSVPALVKEYKYELEDGLTSSGTLGIYPVYTSPVFYETRVEGSVEYPYEQDSYYGNDPAAHNFLLRSSSTIIPLAYSNGSPVAYKRVVEKTIGNGNYLGRTERYFKSFINAPVMIVKPFPYTPPGYKDWCNGLLDSILIYNQQNVLLKKEKNDYKFYDDNYWQDPSKLESFRSLTIAPVKFTVQSSNPSNPSVLLGPVYFKSNNFYPTAGRAELIRTTTSDYAGGNEIKSEVNYVYDSENLYLKSTGSKNSKGEEVATSYTYPEDMISSGRDPNGVYQQMISKNIINAEIEVIKKNGIQQLSLQRKNYFNPYPNVYVPQTVEVKNADNPAETRLRYYAYDISGKPLTILKEADNKITYIWGYNNQYIVAKIEGEDYNIAKQYINQTILNNAANYTDDQIRIETNKLRQNLTKALVTTYTYNPFGEISSQCDANNRIIYYEYDPFGRLKLIRDQNKKIIKTFDYKYQQ